MHHFSDIHFRIMLLLLIMCGLRFIWMEQMKTKRFAVLLACVLCTTIVVLLYGDPSVQPSIQNLVTETHSRFANWKTFQVKVSLFLKFKQNFNYFCVCGGFMCWHEMHLYLNCYAYIKIVTFIIIFNELFRTIYL